MKNEAEVTIEIHRIDKDGVKLKITAIKDENITETNILGPYKSGDKLELSLEIHSSLIVVEHK